MSKFVKSFLVTLLVIVLIVFIYGSIIEPRFLLDVQTFDAEVPHLPESWEEKKLALIADFQIGMWWENKSMVSKAINEAINQNVDVVLIAGDFVYKPDTIVIDRAVDLLTPLLDNNIPVIAVLGNHDYSMMKDKSDIREDLANYLAENLKKRGVKVLENESYPLNNNGDTVRIVGIGSEWAKKSNPDEILNYLNDQSARIIFMHNPLAFREMEAHVAPLTLAAHTHGGQIRLPLFPSKSWLDIARKREVVAEGWSTNDVGNEGNRLYVNRGLGFSLIPVRLFCRPELTIFTLKKANLTLPDREPGQEEEGSDDAK